MGQLLIIKKTTSELGVKNIFFKKSNSHVPLLFSGLNFETISELTGYFFPLQRKKCTPYSQKQKNQVKRDCCCRHCDIFTGVYCIEIIQQDFILQLYKSHNIEEKTYIIG